MAFCGCHPVRDNTTEKAVYNVGSWRGRVITYARLVTHPEQYRNRAWRVEANVSLDEFNDGSVKGKAIVDFFLWDLESDGILLYDEIATGRWDKYNSFELALSGVIDQNGYVVRPNALPVSLPDQTSPGRILDFYDFLYPTEIRGEWPKDNSRIMLGESIRPQGSDIQELSAAPDFKEVEVKYTWSIEKL
jgi:hypothetical protein